MKKVAILLFTLTFFLNSQVLAKENFTIQSKNASLYLLNEDKILYSKNADEKISIASLTKMMTAIVAIEHIKDFNKKVTITSDVFVGTEELSKAGFMVGEKVTYYDLLYGALLPSGGEATNALAINTAGSVKKFVKWMNDKAKELGMKNSHFVNTSGLDHKDHYSTMNDMIILLKYAYANPVFKKVYTTDYYTTSNKRLKLQSLVSKYAQRYGLNAKKITGSKTGFTDDAGLCLASVSEIDGLTYMLATCHANPNSGKPYQVLDAITVYNYYSYNYKYHTILEKGKDLVTLPIKNSDKKQISFKANKEIKKYMKNDFDKSKLTYEYNGYKELTPDNKKGEKIGTVAIKYNNKKIDSYDIILNEDIESNLFDKVLECSGVVLAGFIVFLIVLQYIFNFFNKNKEGEYAE